MLSTDTTILFFTTSLLLAVVPGPDNIFVLTQSMMRGWISGLFVTSGLMTGLIFHTAAVALGVSVIFQTSQAAFVLLKMVGAVYLVYLAIMAFRSGENARSTTQETKNPWILYRRGIVMNITNPKVSIFFLAFLPQFTDPSRGSITVQMLLLGGIFILSTLIIFSAVSFSAGKLGSWLKETPGAERVLNKLAGCVFLGLAVKLAFTER